MDLYERQQFDLMLQVAVEGFAERIEQIGADRVKLGDFVNALFSDFLMDNADGATFVLRALARQSAPTPAPRATVEEALIVMAKSVFADLLQRKTDENLALRAGYRKDPHGDRDGSTH